MYDFSIGVMLESFKLPIPEAIKKAKELGPEGIQVYATYGELSPHNLVGAKRKEFLDMVKSNGLVISALCGDLGKGFHDPAKNPDRGVEADIRPCKGAGNQRCDNSYRCCSV